MTSTPNPHSEIDDAEIRDWLLHRLDAQRVAEIERRLFVDADLPERIDAVESDLIDDCAHGRLSADEARIVRARDAWRVRFAQALAQVARPATLPMSSTRPRTPVLRRVGFGFAIAASLLLAVSVVRWRTIVPTPPAPPADVAALPVVTLLAGQQRGETLPIALPAHAGDVRLQAEIDGAAQDGTPHYALSVSAAGRVVFVARDLAARSAGPYRFVEAVVPSAILGPDVHRVAVFEESMPDTPAAIWEVQMPR